MFIYVNGEKIRLETGDVIFVNSGQIHIWYSDVIAGCSYACAILHPALLGCEPGLRDKLVKPVMRNTGIPFAVFRAKRPNRSAVESWRRRKARPRPATARRRRRSARRCSSGAHSSKRSPMPMKGN